MAIGTYNKSVLVDNDQIITVFLNLEDYSTVNYDETIIIASVDCSNYSSSITDPNTQVELVLTNAIYSLSNTNGTNKAELNIAYEAFGYLTQTVDVTNAKTIISLPSNAHEINFHRGIGKDVVDSTAEYTGNIVFGTHNKAISGYAVLTFYKKSGFLRNSKKYRKATQANPYSN